MRSGNKHNAKLFLKLGFDESMQKESTKLGTSMREWRKQQRPIPGEIDEALSDWHSSYTQSTLRTMTEEFLSYNALGNRTWGPSSSHYHKLSLHYPEDVLRIRDLLMQLFWRQNQYEMKNRKYLVSKASSREKLSIVSEGPAESSWPPQATQELRQDSRPAIAQSACSPNNIGPETATRHLPKQGCYEEQDGSILITDDDNDDDDDCDDSAVDFYSQAMAKSHVAPSDERHSPLDCLASSTTNPKQMPSFNQEHIQTDTSDASFSPHVAARDTRTVRLKQRSRSPTIDAAMYIARWSDRPSKRRRFTDLVPSECIEEHLIEYEQHDETVDHSPPQVPNVLGAESMEAMNADMPQTPAFDYAAVGYAGGVHDACHERVEPDASQDERSSHRIPIAQVKPPSIQQDLVTVPATLVADITMGASTQEQRHGSPRVPGTADNPRESNHALDGVPQRTTASFESLSTANRPPNDEMNNASAAFRSPHGTGAAERLPYIRHSKSTRQRRICSEEWKDGNILTATLVEFVEAVTKLAGEEPIDRFVLKLKTNLSTIEYTLDTPDEA